MKMNFSIPALALIGGVAIGYFLSSNPKEDNLPKEEQKASRPHAMIADKGEDASMQALRDRVKELEAELARMSLFSASSEEDVIEENRISRREERRRESFNERIERIKKEDPERYTQMTNDMRRWREARKERAQSKIDFLDRFGEQGLVASGGSVDRLKSAIVEREEIEEKIHQENLSDEERDTIMRSMFETDREIGELNAHVRQDLFAAMAQDLGFTGEESSLVVEELNMIIEATSGNFGAPGGPRPGGARGPRGGGPGGRGPR